MSKSTMIRGAAAAVAGFAAAATAVASGYPFDPRQTPVEACIAYCNAKESCALKGDIRHGWLMRIPESEPDGCAEYCKAICLPLERGGGVRIHQGFQRTAEERYEIDR